VEKVAARGDGQEGETHSAAALWLRTASMYEAIPFSFKTLMHSISSSSARREHRQLCFGEKEKAKRTGSVLRRDGTLLVELSKVPDIVGAVTHVILRLTLRRRLQKANRVRAEEREGRKRKKRTGSQIAVIPASPSSCALPLM
jgi:hypothetical protein